MPFVSIEFATFFIFFFPLYWLFSSEPLLQNMLLIAASLFWLTYLHPIFAIAVVIYVIAIGFFANKIYQEPYQLAAKKWLYGGVGFALITLVFFKYYDFFRGLLPNEIRGHLSDILFPLGMSYYTFQSISYLIALYQDKPVKLDWQELLLYLSFFPTITAGPIFRAENTKYCEGAAEQLAAFKYREIQYPALAISFILLGIIKKWWFAGVLGEFVEPVFENPEQFDALSILLAIYGYTAQLFFDFSGYSNLAIGLAMLLGFQLPPNFSAPLLAANIRDFWKCWHISLSTWIRDYIYIPLGGNRGSFWRTQWNLLVAMVLSGMWHGYGWNFLLWGTLHGLALIFLNVSDVFFGRERLKAYFLGRLIGIFFTANFVSFSFVIFRTETLEAAKGIFSGLWNANLIFDTSTLITAVFLLGAFIFYRFFITLFQLFVKGLEKLPPFLWALPISLVLITVMIFAPSGIPNFIYAGF